VADLTKRLARLMSFIEVPSNRTLMISLLFS
jgi:hypothetical protein